MNLHEYQAKNLMADYRIPISPGHPAGSIDEAVQKARLLGGDSWVIKAQVHAGGRGKAGGVKIANNIEEVEQYTRDMLGQRLVTHQSGAEGQPVHCVLVQAKETIKSELYLGMLVNREWRCVTVIMSAAGGMDIEQIAKESPESLHQEMINPSVGLLPYQARRLGFALGLDAEQRKQLAQLLGSCYQLFVDKDLAMLEINPLAINDLGQLRVLDAKISLDDNALFRQKTLAEWNDLTQENDKESQARRFSLNYVKLDGNIGCMVNGAGLAMATMDVIQLQGGKPANFLDVGGGTTAERVTEAFRIITADKQVKAILVNIFGGIVRCDLIADGIIEALNSSSIDMPVIVRLEGTNSREGKKKLEQSGLKLATADDLNEAATKAVQAVR